ncbi:MAG: hypothetical protein Q7J98_06490 [Kiritimatiellia bacterium]|nr:hypothetical protein [Kiritimatiellia bacterium]
MKKRTSMIQTALALLLLANLAYAAEIRVIDQEISIQPGETQAFEFGTVPQADTTVTMEIVARMNYETLLGSSMFMQMQLNSRTVDAAKSRTVTRLLNKPVVSPVIRDLPATWFNGGTWRLLYAPDFEGARKIDFYVDDPYKYVLDITDLTNPAAENRLEITNIAKKHDQLFAGGFGQLVIQSIIIRTQPSASPTMISAVIPVINTGQPGAGPAAYTGTLLPGGGFRITTGDQQWNFSSAISFPNAGLNRLLPKQEVDKTGQPQWAVTTTRTDDGGDVVASGPDYRVLRRVRFTPRRVTVADTFTNPRADAPLGLLVRHELDLSHTPAALVRIAGNPDPSVNKYYAPGNPSVHVAVGDTGLGIICEDTIFRNQAWLFCETEPACAGVRTEMLYLPPGASRTLEWAVYPVASSDYFDFINLVRQDWGSNYTVEGAWTFFYPDTIIAKPVEKLREQFNRLGIKRASYCGGWVDGSGDLKKIGFGTGVLDPYWASFRDRLRQAALKIRAAVPDCKVYVYYDTQRDTSAGGHERFKDSWLTDPKGNQLSTTWSGAYNLTYSMVATLQNTFGKAMLQAVDRYLDEMKVDGLYWDEMEGVAFGRPLITYNIPDGYSCEINPKDYTITREIGITSILGEAHRLAVIKRVRERGGDMMGNGPIATKDILALKPQRMVEIQHNECWAYEGNLGSPLGYASSRTDFGAWIRALRMATLLMGSTHTYPHEISRYVFPFTPLELHPGYLLGRERIITIHDGNYGWPEDKCLVATHHFDAKGMLTTQSFPTTIESRGTSAWWQRITAMIKGMLTAQSFPATIKGEARTRVTLKEGEAAILERLPVVVTSHGGQVEARNVQYGPEGLKLLLTAPAGAKLRISSGALPLKAGGKYAVRIDDKTQQVVAEKDGSLTLDVKGLAMTIEVKP